MLNTIATLVTGAMIATSPINENSVQQNNAADQYFAMEALTEVVYNVSVNSTTEELEDIKTAAEEAGMGFTYKKRGVKTRLVIDMVIETEEDYTMERLVIREDDGAKTISWSVNDKGQAVAFIKDTKVNLTQHSK